MMLDLARLATHLRQFPRQTIPVGSLRPAAVLVPLFRRQDADHLLFTERTAHLAHHAGEISFPGGGYSEEDDSLVATALRETEEELGIARAEIVVLGRLDDFYSVHGYHVVPYVGLIPGTDNLAHDPAEIAGTFEAPLEHFRAPGVHQVKDWHHRGALHRLDFYRYEEHVIWGLTAAILRQLLEETTTLRYGATE